MSFGTWVLMTDEYGDGQFCDESEIDYLGLESLEIDGRYDLLAQFDQDARGADDAMATVCEEIAFLACHALARALGRPATTSEIDCSPIREALGPWTDGGAWVEVDDEHDAERVHWELEHWKSVASMVGLIVEWDGDAGTVSILAPIAD